MTAPKNKRKPKKPKGSPFSVGSNGQWLKKVDGKLKGFGPWDDHAGALKRYHELMTGRSSAPAEANGEVTVKELCNLWLDHQKGKFDNGELSQRSWDDNLRIAKRIVEVFGPNREADSLQPKDFKRLRKKITDHHKSLHVVKREVISTKAPFKYGAENRLIRLPFYGTEFNTPTAAQIRKQRSDKKREHGEVRFTADEIRLILENCNPAMRAMVLLGANCGLENESIKQLREIDLNLSTGWLDYDRRKTGIQRRSKLWPETVQAIRAYLEVRPEPNETVEHADTVFVTKYGNQYGVGKNFTISKEFGKLLRKLGIKRMGVNHYALRHTFLTEAENLVRDSPATKLAMGHVDSSITASYRENISDDRLEAISNALHRWLFGKKAAAKKKATKTKKAKAKSSKKSKRKTG